MAGKGSILIADQSALHALLHRDWGASVERNRAHENPLLVCASTLDDLRAFNVQNPLYGPPPISLLVKSAFDRRRTDDFICRYTSAELPPASFFELRSGLFMATPELVFVRMARFATEAQLAEIGMNLCARYYLDLSTGKIKDRSCFITTPEKLRAYALAADGVMGSKEALAALRWVIPNSGSPYETKMKLLYCHPLGKGGFGLPFTAMNYDVKAGRLQRIMKQSTYSIDMVDERRKVGMEYDGEESHLDASHDKRRRNDLAALGWTIFPIDKSVLHDYRESISIAEQVAKRMGLRIRRSPRWDGKYRRLRAELRLPFSLG